MTNVYSFTFKPLPHTESKNPAFANAHRRQLDVSREISLAEKRLCANRFYNFTVDSMVLLSDKFYNTCG